MKIVGLTGGIGSGKTTVANFFKELGIPIYIADVEAKALMNRSKIIKRKLKRIFGEEAYKDEKLNRPFLAEKIFNNKQLLKEMNAIVHPKVASHFKRWIKRQKSPYVIKEAAILFENDTYKQCDFVITVTASFEEKIERILKRDKTTEEKIEKIMSNQWSDSQRIQLSDFVISNKDLTHTKNQVKEIHNKILKLIH